MVKRFGKSKDGPISRYLNRYISIYITKFFLKIHEDISPNTVSIICFLISIISGLFFILSLPVIGGILIQLSSIMDGCDGEIARLKNKATKFGGFFDSVLDRFADGFIFISIIIYLRYFWEYPEYIDILYITGIMAVLGSILISYTAAQASNKFNIDFSRTIEGRDVRLFVIMIGGIAAYFWYFSLFITLIYIAIVSNLFVFIRINNLRKIK